MALFKVFRGKREDLEKVAKVDGHAYFCTDDGSFWIDYSEGNNNIVYRKQVNENDLNKINILSEDNIWTGLNQFDLEKIQIGSNDITDDYDVRFLEDGVVLSSETWDGRNPNKDAYWIPSIKLTTNGPHDYTEYKSDKIIYEILDQESQDWSKLHSELIFPEGKTGTIALIEDLSGNYVTLDTEQTITGSKTFDTLNIKDIDISDGDKITLSGHEIAIRQSYQGEYENYSGKLILGTNTGPDTTLTLNQKTIERKTYDFDKADYVESTLTFPESSGTFATQEWVGTEVQSLQTKDNIWTGFNQFSLINTSIGNMHSADEPYFVRFEEDGMLFTAMKGEQGGDYFWMPSIKLTTMGPPHYTEYKSDKIIYKIGDYDSGLHSELIFPKGEIGTLATQEWVQANTICSSTIDQEFFNSLY